MWAILIAAAVTLNMSPGGLAVRTTSPLEKDTALKVRFRLPGVGKEIDAECSVTWTDRAIGHGSAVHENRVRRPEGPRRLRAHPFLLESKSISAGSERLMTRAEPGLRAAYAERART